MLMAFFEQFFLFGEVPDTAVSGTYVLSFVFLSYIIASMGAFTGLVFADNILQAKNKRDKYIFHLGGAFAFGAGIWAMHFVGMLAYKMDMVHSYDPFLTFVSMNVAVFIAYGVLKIIRHENINFKTICCSSILLGTGICLMHYIGMSAMDMRADLKYQAGYFFVSFLIAVIASAAALMIVFVLGRHVKRAKLLLQFVAALVMGVAVCGMHYTGMEAAVFLPFADCRFDPNQSYDTLAMIVAIVSSIIFIIALTVSLYTRSEAENNKHIHI